MIVLGIESSCDETAASVVSFEDNKINVAGSSVASQIPIHALYGGVVPEIASRAHTEALNGVLTEALTKAGMEMKDIDAIAVTYGPGLIGALLAGVNFAKGLAFSYKKPLVPVHHVHGHISAAYIEHPDLEPNFLALAASGGHTSVIDVKSHTDFQTIGFTRDDAIGECFDKTARVMGIPYPGGAVMDKLAKEGDKKAIKFPSPAINDGTLDFSFSGLKTAVINYLHNCEQKGIEINKADVAASLTYTICKAVSEKLEKALELTGRKTLVLAGGVAANSHLRNELEKMCLKNGVKFVVPSICYCGDNGSMIAVQGYFEYQRGNFADSSLNGVARP